MTEAQRQRLESIGPNGEELARYGVSSEERRLIGSRTRDGLEIFDAPTCGAGRRYRVDGGLHDPGAIAALVSDYLAQAHLLDACPMAPMAIESMLCPSDTDDLLSLFLGGVGW